jgi:peptide/nickel transport system ATP-binding protein
LLRDLCRATGSAFIYVTHDLAVVDAIADRVLIMYAGRIIEEGTRYTILRRPAHPYSALLLSSVPRLAVRRLLTGISGTAPDPRSRPVGCSFAPRCPIASDVCRSTFPSVTRIGPQQLVRCWHAGQLVASAPICPPPASPVAGPTTALLEVKHLSAGYAGALQRPVVRDIGFRLGEGECLALIGESGSGKSTIGRCVVGLHRPNAGEVLLRGEVLSAHASQRLQAERRAIQLIFQNPDRSLNPNETIGEAIRRPLRLFDLADRGTEWAYVAEMLERVRLPGSTLHRYPRELSGGEKQRVAIARALAAKPALLVCDEITSSLDVSTQAAIVALLTQLKEAGLALLFITHNLALVRSFADQILVLESGDVRETGSASQVIDYPMHPYTRELVAAAPDIRER